MTNTEAQALRRAITLLSSLINEPQECVLVPYQSPIRLFVQEYLVPDADADLTCDELWIFFQEVVRSGELPPMRKAIFLRQLPTTMEVAYQVRKCHSIVRNGRPKRGFRGVAIRMDTGLPTVIEVQNDAG